MGDLFATTLPEKRKKTLKSLFIVCIYKRKFRHRDWGKKSFVYLTVSLNTGFKIQKFHISHKKHDINLSKFARGYFGRLAKFIKFLDNWKCQAKLISKNDEKCICVSISANLMHFWIPRINFRLNSFISISIYGISYCIFLQTSRKLSNDNTEWYRQISMLLSKNPIIKIHNYWVKKCRFSH